MKSQPDDGDPEELAIVTVDKEFDESFKYKDIVPVDTPSAQDLIKILKDFLETQDSVEFYESKTEYKVLIKEKQKKFKALFEVLRVKTAEGTYAYYLLMTKEKGDLLEYKLFTAAARKYLE